MAVPKFKILSIDGGGIRGIIPCKILSYLEDQLDLPLHHYFDLIAGTSTGGIITMGLTMPNNEGENKYTAKDLLSLYKNDGWQIFYKRKSDFISSVKPVFGKTVDKLFQNPYESEGIEEILHKKFGEAKLSESLTNILITTYGLEEGRPFYFLSRLAKIKENEDFLLKRIARSTSAAPTFFIPSEVEVGQETHSFVDGGVFANNPSVLAYGEAKELIKNTGTLAFDPDVKPTDKDLPIFMLSIGTGRTPKLVDGGEAVNWKSKNWIEPMMEIFMQGVAESTHYTMQHLLPKYTDGTSRYIRLNFNLPEGLGEMDNALDVNIDALCAEADIYIEKNKELLDNIARIINNTISNNTIILEA